MSVKIALFFLASLLLVGCGGGYVGYGVAAPPPPVTVGVVGVAPGPGYVWIDGFWDLRGGRWAWVGGRWARPPRARARWEPDRWERHGNHWRHSGGRWR
ncbi:MAG TPA: hypothetical protein VMH80_20695 [Bryobacteraceae bacterium]|nr:hypothetical protein [Bryobacteraceae bacterium]